MELLKKQADDYGLALAGEQGHGRGELDYGGAVGEAWDVPVRLSHRRSGHAHHLERDDAGGSFLFVLHSRATCCFAKPVQAAH